MRWLLSKGADPNFGRMQEKKLSSMGADNESGFTLDHAAAFSTTAAIDLLINEGAKREYSHALHAAAEGPEKYGDRIPMMKHVLESGFEVDGIDRHSRGPHGQGSPLMCTVRFGKIDRARFLLENGANPHLKNW